MGDVWWQQVASLHVACCPRDDRRFFVFLFDFVFRFSAKKPYQEIELVNDVSRWVAVMSLYKISSSKNKRKISVKPKLKSIIRDFHRLILHVQLIIRFDVKHMIWLILLCCFLPLFLLGCPRGAFSEIFTFTSRVDPKRKQSAKIVLKEGRLRFTEALITCSYRWHRCLPEPFCLLECLLKCVSSYKIGRQTFLCLNHASVCQAEPLPILYGVSAIQCTVHANVESLLVPNWYSFRNGFRSRHNVPRPILVFVMAVILLAGFTSIRNWRFYRQFSLDFLPHRYDILLIDGPQTLWTSRCFVIEPPHNGIKIVFH